MNVVVYSVLLSFLIALLTGLLLIPVTKRLKLGQNIREDGPKSHQKKAGTPTFGGIIFIFSSIITLFVFIKYSNKESLILALAFLSFGIIGFIDDSLKKIHKKNEGLTPAQKLILLLLVSGVFTIYTYHDASIGSTIVIPFINKSLNLGVFYIPFIIFVYVATTNAVNLTDGLDGLATSVTLLIMMFFIMLSYNLGHYSASLFYGCVSGSLLGFLRYNSYPAKIIMGDTGSLALGGLVATAAITLQNPIIIVIVGGIYVIEVVSDLIQITVYKLTGKRFFKMAPLHHSFELSGWHESKIVSLFSIITAVLCFIGFLAF